ncbi:MAG: hypothetical protein J0L53_03765 [Spirochaetes bacterium]|nr:hypothetical protein [Spirochaetota bacterium]MBX3723218.1 hypothetical protein [Turneriella sp.]
MESKASRKALQKLTPAEYSRLLKLYLNDKKQHEAMKMASENLSALEMLVQFETMVAVNKRQGATAESSDFKLPIHQIVEIAEKFFSVDDPRAIEKELSNSKVWQTIKGNNADFGLFQDTLAFLFTWGDRPMIPTPAYLKQIVMNRIYASAPVEEESTIVIRLKDGLRLIAGHIRDLYNLTNNDEMVAVRGNDTATAARGATGALQFMTSEEKQGDLFYQVVKDGNDTVMLTVKLQNYRPRPKFINLRRQGRLLQSLPLRDDFAWFSQLAVGKYEIELQNGGSTASKRIDIHIV